MIMSLLMGGESWQEKVDLKDREIFMDNLSEEMEPMKNNFDKEKFSKNLNFPFYFIHGQIMK